MTTDLAATITFADETTSIRLTDGDTGTADGGSTFAVPCGVRSLGERHIHSDPPLPEELTNAIGEMMDHLEDAKRELPRLVNAVTVVVQGPIPVAIAAVEVGGPVEGPRFALARDAAEDVFRTVATENHADRRRNPGLPADLVSVIVGGCCALVGVIRGLHLDGVEVLIDGADT
jgi:exopolyphosphatase / guanosine-5'-triphosphate,3'-diphosphate pyrophosphatase